MKVVVDKLKMHLLLTHTRPFR